MIRPTYFLRYTKRCMIFLGTMELEFSKSYLTYMYKTWVFLFLVCFSLFCISYAIGAVVRLVALEFDKEELTFHLIFVMVIVKIIFSQTKMAKKIIEDLFKLESGIENDDVGAKKKYLRHSRYNFKVFFMLAMMYYGTFIQMTMAMKDLWPKKLLFFSLWFPFDYKNYYTFTFIFHIAFQLSIALFAVTFDSFYCSFILFPSMLLDILGDKFEQFEDYYKKQLLAPRAALRNLILEHKAIIRFVEDVDSSLKWFFFVDFLVRSYHLSMIIYTVIMVDAINVALAIAVCKLLCVMLQAWCLYCHGNELIIKSLDIADKIYRSNWYEQDMVVKKMLLIIMLRSRRPLELRVGIFQTMSNDLMVKYFKVSATLIAQLLRN